MWTEYASFTVHEQFDNTWYVYLRGEGYCGELPLPFNKDLAITLVSSSGHINIVPPEGHSIGSGVRSRQLNHKGIFCIIKWESGRLVDKTFEASKALNEYFLDNVDLTHWNLLNDR